MPLSSSNTEVATGGNFDKEDPEIDQVIDPDDDDGDEVMPSSSGSASTPGPFGEDIRMQTMHHEQSGLPTSEQSYAKTSFGGVSTDEIERRLHTLRNPTGGLLDTTKIDPHENLLSQEDKAKEVQRVKIFIKARYMYPSANLANNRNNNFFY